MQKSGKITEMWEIFKQSAKGWPLFMVEGHKNTPPSSSGCQNTSPSSEGCETPPSYGWPPSDWGVVKHRQLLPLWLWSNYFPIINVGNFFLLWANHSIFWGRVPHGPQVLNQTYFCVPKYHLVLTRVGEEWGYKNTYMGWGGGCNCPEWGWWDIMMTWNLDPGLSI